MGEFFTLHCTSCGATLEILTGIEQFACGNCGVPYQVKRGGGIVSIVALIKEMEPDVNVPASSELPESEQVVEIQPQLTPFEISEESSKPTPFQEEKPKFEVPIRKPTPPVAKPAWPIERETQPPWQNPPRRQPTPWGKYFVYLLILSVVLALTNPSKERQEAVIGKQIVAYTRSVGGDVGEQIEGEQGGIGGLIGWLTGSFVGGVVEEALMQLDIFQYNNYYLVSTMTLKDKVISFGILRFTILVTPVDEWMTDMEFSEILAEKVSGSETLQIMLSPLLTPFPQVLTPVSPSSNTPSETNELKVAEQNLATANAKITELQSEITTLKNRIAELSTLEAANQALQTDLEMTQLHAHLLDALVDVRTAQYALAQDDPASTNEQLATTSATLTEMQKFLDGEQAQSVDAFLSRLELALGELEFNPFAAQSDLETLAKGLLQLEETLLNQPSNPTKTTAPVVAPTKAPTKRPSSTPFPTETPFSFVTPPTMNSSATATPIFAYIIDVKHPLYLNYNVINTTLGCNFMGVGGNVFDLNNSPQNGLIIELGGTIQGLAVTGLAVSGTAQSYGQSGYELPISDGTILSNKTLYVQVRDQAGAAVSDKIYFDTFDDCEKNLILINFYQTR